MRSVEHLQREDFEALDECDPLAPLRERFLLPPGVIYLDGNSLGALPRSTPARLSRVIEHEWGEGLIASWNRHGWMAMPQRVGGKIARLIGADPSEVVVAESTSINLFKVLAAALKMRPERRVIVSEVESFPTDIYMAEGLAELLDQGHALRLVAADELKPAARCEVAALLLTHVNFRSGAMHDMAALNAAAHAAGASGDLGFRPFGRRGAGRPRRGAGGFRGRLRLQISSTAGPARRPSSTPRHGITRRRRSRLPAGSVTRRRSSSNVRYRPAAGIPAAMSSAHRRY